MNTYLLPISTTEEQEAGVASAAGDGKETGRSLASTLGGRLSSIIYVQLFIAFYGLICLLLLPFGGN